MTEQKQYVVRAKYANKFEFIFLESNELTVEKFMLNGTSFWKYLEHIFYEFSTIFQS